MICAIALLRRRGQPRAGAHEVEVNALQHAALFGRQGQRVALLVQRIDALEQRRRWWTPALWCAASMGAMRRSTACSSGEVSLDARL